jgi:threonyl-tRNA synthetase
MGTDEDWELATRGLKEALEDWGQPFQINEGDGAFYGPKIDIHIQDALNRSWQCGTIQLDLALPEKFTLEYTDSDGLHKRPIMLHRALFGSIERFFGILIEHFAGKFPLWISPRQIAILTVADRHRPQAYRLLKELRQQGFTVDLDESAESVGKKVREAQMQQFNYMLTIGDREAENGHLSVRTRANSVHFDIPLDAFVSALKQEISEKSLSPAFKEKQ